MLTLQIAMKRNYWEFKLMVNFPSKTMFANCARRLAINFTHLLAYPSTSTSTNLINYFNNEGSVDVKRKRKRNITIIIM